MVEATLDIGKWNLGLQAVARECRVHVESVRRWATVGKAGVDEQGNQCAIILETIFVGARMRTSRKALDEFLTATNRGRRGRRPHLEIRTPAQREQAVQSADDELDQDWAPKPFGRPRKKR